MKIYRLLFVDTDKVILGEFKQNYLRNRSIISGGEKMQSMSIQPAETKQIKINTIKLPSPFLAFLIYGRIKEISLNVSLQFLSLLCFCVLFPFFSVFFLNLLVPSLPPQNVHSYNTSSTSVNVTWEDVATGFIHGILRGYRVFYSRTNDNGAAVRPAVIRGDKHYVHLEGLDKFTNYTIQAAAFTRIGYGANSTKLIVSTDEDGIKFHLLPTTLK